MEDFMAMDIMAPLARSTNCCLYDNDRASITTGDESTRKELKVNKAQGKNKEGEHDNDADRPKRARSAYNFFFRAERARILGVTEEELDAQQQQKRKHRKTPGMMGFAQLASYVGDKWRMLSEEEKNPYHQRCQEDRVRYNRDLKNWRKKHGYTENDHPEDQKDSSGAGEKRKTTARKVSSGVPVMARTSSSHNATTTNLEESFTENVERNTTKRKSYEHPPASCSDASKRRKQDALQIVHETSLGFIGANSTNSVVGISGSEYLYLSIQRREEEERRIALEQQREKMKRLADAFEPTPIDEMVTHAVLKSNSTTVDFHQGQSSLQDLYNLMQETPEWQTVFQNF